jgi:hypothetical protein
VNGSIKGASTSQKSYELRCTIYDKANHKADKFISITDEKYRKGKWVYDNKFERSGGLKSFN